MLLAQNQVHLARNGLLCKRPSIIVGEPTVSQGRRLRAAYVPSVHLQKNQSRFSTQPTSSYIL